MSTTPVTSGNMYKAAMSTPLAPLVYTYTSNCNPLCVQRMHFLEAMAKLAVSFLFSVDIYSVSSLTCAC